MPGRPLLTDEVAARRGFGDAASRLRRQVLRETVTAFAEPDAAARLRSIAAANLERWQAAQPDVSTPLLVDVIPGDWSDVTLQMTKQFGATFAVLNMANACVPGGGYVEGAAAQEENMYRRTDCHYYIDAKEYDSRNDRYRPAMTRLLNAESGKVYLDCKHPRVCIRGSEDRSAMQFGYRRLDDTEIFPFFEMRSAAQDLRFGGPFDRADATRRIAAQLDTLRKRKVRHAVLGAHGCGAFNNPSREIAAIYRQEIEARRSHFSVLVFAIYHAGYGPGNFAPFAQEFKRAAGCWRVVGTADVVACESLTTCITLLLVATDSRPSPCAMYAVARVFSDTPSSMARVASEACIDRASRSRN